ncbi:MAG: iron ABC transporter permease [Candidatus Desulfofervidus auxilii]|nr:iron ABC transporter permease [Candidatus Desulfofervidus auxilii]
MIRKFYICIFVLFIIVNLSLFWGLPLEWPFSSATKIILWQLRLPRVILAGLAGGALGISGAVLQTLFLNPLAEPYILGISGGAALGGALALLLGINLFGLGITLGAFAGAIFALFLLLGWIGLKGEISTYFLLLAGVVLNALFSSIILFIFALVKSEVLRSIYFWLLGDLSTVGLNEVGWLIFFVFFCSLGCFYYAYALDAFAQSEIIAYTLGFSVEKIKRQLLIIVSLLVGATVAVTGMIGFVGLITPHVVRMWVGSGHRQVLPFSFLCGSGFLILSDTLARQLFTPLEMPVGVITSILGAPFFLYLLKCHVKTN